jgi:hypothetical protein
MTSINDISSVSLHNTEQMNIDKINCERLKTANKYTLEYLTNPLYYKNRPKTITNELNKHECSFYKKRIVAITKDMLKGYYPSQHLEKIHKEYIQSLIHHFKRVDEVELIQQEYNDIDANVMGANVMGANVLDPSNTEIIKSELNNEIMMKKNKPVSIENFVTKKVIQVKTDIPIPKKKVLNVNTPAHKIKGIPPKIHKDKV